jgi:hypothetical protein
MKARRAAHDGGRHKRGTAGLDELGHDALVSKKVRGDAAYHDE